MRVHVTNLSCGARGVHTAGGGTVLLEPGASAPLDLVDHPAHDAWVAAGEIALAPIESEGSAAPRKPPARTLAARTRDA